MASPVLDNVLPVFLLMGLGAVLRAAKLTTRDFYTISDKLIYFIFFPALLFGKISASQLTWSQAGPLAGGSLLAIFLVWLASLLYIRLFKVAPFQAGTFSQVSYRFNTYVGMAVVISAHGAQGAVWFGIIISLAIPFINVLAVSTMIWFSGASYSLGQKLGMLVKAMLVNPLILACLAGLLYARLGPPLPQFFRNTLGLMSSITLPLALLSIGASLSLRLLKSRLGLNLAASGLKLVLLPVVGGLILWGLGVDDLPWRVAMIYFTLPTATSAYILSTQMNSDTELASASIVLSTLLSFFSLSVALTIF